MRPLTSSEFLHLVWPRKLLTHEMLELRVIQREDGKMHRQFAPSVDDFLERAAAHKQREVYFSVATRFGSDGTKIGCYRVAALWCDLDKRSLDECDFDPQPDILVNSGGGVHAYWLLDKPVLVRDRWELIEKRTRWLAKRFKGDMNTCDIARILRVPAGFYNHKYSPAREVKAYAL